MSSVPPPSSPKELLDTMLGYLGFIVEIQEQERDGMPILQIITSEPQRLIGRHDEILDDLQFLLNRLWQHHHPQAQRIIVDVCHHRAMRDDALIAKVRHMAESVRATGIPVSTEPLNAYDRRLIHQAFANDPEITTSSPKDDARLKRITLKRRPKT